MSNSRTWLKRQGTQATPTNEYSAFFASSSISEKVRSPHTNAWQTHVRVQAHKLFLGGSLLLVAADLLLGITTGITGQQGQLPGLLWNWSHLFSVPLVLISGGFWYAGRSTARARGLAAEVQYEQLLYTYLDHMSSLSQPQSLEEYTGDTESLTRAWTVLALQKLDSERKGLVIRFLCEAGLLQQKLNGNLESFDLKNTDLSQLCLNQMNFSSADLRNSDLSSTELNCADFKQADLGGARLCKARLNGADLRGAILDKVDLHGADLSGADLSGAILDGANLDGANMHGAVLNGTTLLHTTFSPEQLEVVRSAIGLIS